ncbi:MAG TPA: hypothetical protein PLM23_09240 [Syntrophorhabdaceae bacterium]|nr:hypothetical protein [Syntrophorhabdaceae bacterium]HPP42679.1 hypothetical protein [Syntrophorhabdaceae bacterium]
MKRINSVLLKAGLVFSAICLVATLAMAKEKKQKHSYIKPTITAEQAISNVKAALPNLTVGKSFIKTGKRGEKKLEVALVLDGKIVSKMRLNPATGEILPKGQEVFVNEVLASQEQAVKIVQQAIPNLEIASVSLGKQGEWKVDLTLKKMVVASINVHGGDGSILPDWKATKDAAMY